MSQPLDRSNEVSSYQRTRLSLDTVNVLSVCKGECPSGRDDVLYLYSFATTKRRGRNRFHRRRPKLFSLHPNCHTLSLTRWNVPPKPIGLPSPVEVRRRRPSRKTRMGTSPRRRKGSTKRWASVWLLRLMILPKSVGGISTATTNHSQVYRTPEQRPALFGDPNRKGAGERSVEAASVAVGELVLTLLLSPVALGLRSNFW
jgi:hypothetical protein